GMKNEEISTIIQTRGAGGGNDFSLEESRYGKVIRRTDADTDGAHREVLLLTCYHRYMRELNEAGKADIALPLLNKIPKGQGRHKQIQYAWEDAELEEALTKMKSGYIIQRYKGLGEMNADQLWETTMNPDSRTLIRVTLENMAQAERRVTTLMGDKVTPRRTWIENNVEFDLAEGETILDK